jgi:hypothetical protein
MTSVDLLICDGKIISLDSNNNIYEWMAVKDGKIFDLGMGKGYEKYIETSQETYFLEGKTAVPGFYDCHVHLVQTGLNFEGVNLYDVKTIEELLSKIRKAAEDTPNGELIRAYRFDVTKTRERRFPTRHELDRVSPNNPVWINSIEFHTSSLNTLALNKINLQYNIDGIARDERNLPLGYFTGKASAFIRNRMFGYLKDDLRMRGLEKAVRYAVSKGVTSINTMEGGFTFHEKDVNFIIENKDKLPIDVKLYFQTFDLKKIFKYNLKCMGGDIFIDGSFGSRTAAISSDYNDFDTRGELYFNSGELNYYVGEAHREGLQIALHAIGDRAIEQVLDAYENAQLIYNRKDHRHRIEHFELATKEQVRRAKELGLVISVQPTFEYYWGNEDGMYERRLGKDLASKTNNFRYMIDNGLILCGGSDSDVNEINPILAIHSAVNHPKKEHSIEVFEALGMFTVNSAFACFEDHLKGSLEKGKYCDVTVLDKDILEVDKDRIKDIKVVATLKEGNIIFCSEDFNLRGDCNDKV